MFGLVHGAIGLAFSGTLAIVDAPFYLPDAIVFYLPTMLAFAIYATLIWFGLRDVIAHLPARGVKRDSHRLFA